MNNSFIKKTAKISVLVVSFIFLASIFINNAIDFYPKRTQLQDKIFQKLRQDYPAIHDVYAKIFPKDILKLNDTSISQRQGPVDKFEDLKIKENAYEIGQWSSPFDWNVVALHSVLLPDSSLMTFGSYGIDKKENLDIRQNKKITLTDGRVMERDLGRTQWTHHDVNLGMDYDVWNFNEGFRDKSHTLFKKPVAMDAFCTIARLIDKDKLFLLGGGKNTMVDNTPDTQNGTVFYNFKDRSFKKFKNLNRKRWYGSAVITGDRKLVIMGGG